MTMLYFKINPNDLYLRITTIATLVLLIIVLNVWLLYYDQKLQAKETLITIYQKELPIYEALISDIRATQHEYSNHVQSLQFLTETCKTYESLSNALMEYTLTDVKTMRAYPLLKINMPILAASLYNLYLQAEKSDITVRFDITSEILTCSVSELNLCDYTTILLQNAIEACNSGDYIYVKLGMEDGKFHFETRNPVSKLIEQEQINKFFEKNYSSKKFKKADGISHGLGLYYLLNQVNNNKGLLTCACIETEGNYIMLFSIDL